MNLQVLVDSEIPKLAWCATIEKANQVVRAHVGPAVEVKNDALVEGAWSGHFPDWDFASAETFTGTGLETRGNYLLASAPTHTLAPVYLLRRSESILISNSLPFLLAESGRRLRPQYPFYDRDIMSVILGLQGYVRSLPTDGDSRIELYYLANIRIDTSLRVEVAPKTSQRPFHHYADYLRYLVAESRSLADNARDPTRAIRYDVLATVSSGYDSPACAAIARLAGGRRAITLKEARSGFRDTDDSGRRIGEILGLEVIELSAEDYFNEGQEPREIEILASGFGGDDLVWIGAENHLRGCLLFTGYHGDKVWDKHKKSVSPDIKRGDPSGASLLEFRLRAGFLNFPIPFIGCLNHADIRKISISDEMTPWQLHTDYDRPIPRRIVEECGVPRSYFGQSKKAVAKGYYNVLGPRKPPLEQRLSTKTLAAYRKYLCANDIMVPQRNNSTLTPLKRRLANSHKLKLLSDRLHLKALRRWQWRHETPPTEHDFLTAWAANQLRGTYLGSLYLADRQRR